MSTLELRGVTRRFGDVVALNRVDLAIEPGITALVGPNGAGKSTVMKLATGHVKPTSGTVTAFGMPVWDNPRVMAKLGIVPEQDSFYEFLTGIEFVATLGTLHGIERNEARRLAEEELTRLGLTDGMDRKISTYSKGMRQRVKLAQALIHRPNLLLLDEPLLGCDPVARKRIHDRIVGLAREGCTILVSTHILPEVERMTRDVAVLVSGRLIARGDAREVRDAIGQVPSRVRILCEDPRAAASALAKWPDVQMVRVVPDGVEVETPRLRALLAELQSKTAKTWGLTGFEAVDADLDSLFGYLVEGSS